MSDDAQFEAFLRGEGDLARQLQALPQPSPSAELDAAILERARLAVVQQDRAAANDPGVVQPNNPHLARSVGMRWRVPAGIAAAVLAGLIGHQAFQQSSDMEPAQMSMDDEVVAAPATEVAQAPAPAEVAPAPAVPTPMADMRAKEQSDRARHAATVAEVESVQARRAELGRRSAAAASADAYSGVVASERVAAAPPHSAPAPAPAPAPVVAPAPPPPMERVTVSGSAIKRKTAEGSMPVSVVTTRDVQNTPQAPMPSGDLGALKSVMGENPVAAKPKPPSIPGSVAQEIAAEMQIAMAANGSHLATKEFDPAGWLVEIEALLNAQKNSEAELEWAMFRKAYPDYAVPEALRKRLDEIKKPAE